MLAWNVWWSTTSSCKSIPACLSWLCRIWPVFNMDGRLDCTDLIVTPLGNPASFRSALAFATSCFGRHLRCAEVARRHHGNGWIGGEVALEAYNLLGADRIRDRLPDAFVVKRLHHCIEMQQTKLG